MAENYSGWSVEKLKKERQKIDKAISVAEKRDKKATLIKMAAIARQNGFELHELLSEQGVQNKRKNNGKVKSTQKTSTVRAKVAPKYQNPANRKQTWTGRGRKPLWVNEQLNAGVSLEEMKIMIETDWR